MRRLFCVCLLPLLMQGCSTTDLETFGGEQKKNIFLKDTLLLPVLSTMTYEPWDIYIDSSGFLYNIQKERVELYKINLNDPSMTSRVEFDAYGPNGVGYKMAAYSYLSSDSIYIIPDKENVLIRVDEQGVVQEETKLIVPAGAGVLVAKGGFHMEIIDGVAYVASLLNTSLQPGEVVDIVELGFNIQSGEVVFTFKVPKTLRSEPNSYFIDYSRTIGPNGEHFYSFANNDNIYVANFEGSSAEISLDSFSPKGERRRSSKTDEYQEYLENNSFAFVAYDPYRKVFYRGLRLALDPETIKNEPDLTGGMDDKIPIIEVYDLDWKAVGRIKLPRNQYLLNQYFINEDGLHISTDHPNSNSLDEDLMSFHVFDVR